MKYFNVILLGQPGLPGPSGDPGRPGRKGQKGNAGLSGMEGLTGLKLITFSLSSLYLIHFVNILLSKSGVSLCVKVLLVNQVLMEKCCPKEIEVLQDPQEMLDPEVIQVKPVFCVKNFTSLKLSFIDSKSSSNFIAFFVNLF